MATVICEHGVDTGTDGCARCTEILYNNPLHANAETLLEAARAVTKCKAEDYVYALTNLRAAVYLAEGDITD